MQDFFFFYKASVQALGFTQAGSQWVLGVNWLEREDDRYKHSNAGIKNEWKCTVGAVLRQTTEGMNVYLISSMQSTFLFQPILHDSYLITAYFLKNANHPSCSCVFLCSILFVSLSFTQISPQYAKFKRPQFVLIGH